MKAVRETNGDKVLDFQDRLRYFLHAMIRMIKAYKLDGYNGEDFVIRKIPRNSKSQLGDRSSPIRFYLDIAFLDAFKPLRGRKARILDIGCGSGGNIHHSLCSNIEGRYVGIDINRHAEWADTESKNRGKLKAEFHQMSAYDISGLGQFDVVFSSMFLEHVADLDRAVENMALVAAPGAYLIHAVPAHASFFLYLAHGYRRFSPAEFYALFDSKGIEDIRIYRVGGVGSFLAHLLLITVPERFLKKEIRSKAPQLYRRVLMAGFQLDRHLRRPTIALILIARKGHNGKKMALQRKQYECGV